MTINFDDAIKILSEETPSVIKVHTFPFTKYGVITEKVLGVSPDAIADQEQRLRYKVRLIMDKSNIKVDSRLVELIPGMAVTVDVKTGQRQIIEYLLTPVLKYRSDSIKER